MSIANEYHNATKYHPETIGSGPGVDWTAQPSPYKEFHSKTRVNLGSHLLLAREAETDRPILTQPDELSPTYELSRLSTLLLHINGVTAQQPTQDGSVFFRSAPSAGALYPTEIYVILRDIPGVDDGIYNYQVRDHSLAPVLEGNFWGDLEAQTNQSDAVKAANIVIAFSVIFLRSSWRYQDRAYRRILLDSGHVLGNLMTFAPEIGYSPKAITAFNDAAIDDLMFFDRDNESTLVLAALPEKDVAQEPLGVSEAHPDLLEEDLILQMHRAGAINVPQPKTAEPCPSKLIEGSDAQLTFALSRKNIAWDGDLGPTILLRRSTRSFRGTTMTAEELGMILGFGYQGMQEGGLNDYLDPSRLKTFISVHRVEGLEAGLYRYDPVTSRVLLTRRGFFSREDHEIGLGQELMRDAAAVVYHFANIEEATATLGDRAYRYLNLDAGHIGQRMNLAALKLKLGVSGIGGYFDDQANDLFHRPLSEGLIYVTCLGQP